MIKGIVSVAVVMLVLTSVSGCFGEKAATKSTDHPHVSDEHSQQNGTDHQANLTPPTAVLKITIDGNETMPDANGSIATTAGVNVTFDASGSSGDKIQIAWDFGDGETIGTIPTASGEGDNESDPNATAANETLLGLLLLGFEEQGENDTNSTTTASNETEANTTAAPPENAVVTHAYATNGTYTVTLYVYNDRSETDTETATMEVAAAGTPPGSPAFEEKKELGAAGGSSTALYNGGCGTALAASWDLVDVDANGTAVAISKIVVTMDAFGGTSPVGGVTKLTVKAPNGTVLKTETTGATAKTFTFDGPLPAGTYKVEASKCATLAVTPPESKVKGTATYVTV